MTRNTLKNMNLTPPQPAPASASVSARKSAQRKGGSPSATKTAASKDKARKTIQAVPSSEQVALRAYFIGERRRNMGIPGDETSDWVEAEREISEELKAG